MMMMEEAFFSPNTFYLQDAPYHSPTVVPQFDCKWVGLHPDTREIISLGFGRSGDSGPWNLAALGSDEWKIGWVQDPSRKGRTR
jgi:hypothetical protein